MIRFRHRDEARAWDGFVASERNRGATYEQACRLADEALEARRARYGHGHSSRPLHQNIGDGITASPEERVKAIKAGLEELAKLRAEGPTAHPTPRVLARTVEVIVETCAELLRRADDAESEIVRLRGQVISKLDREAAQ